MIEQRVFSLLEVFGAPGREQPVGALVKEEVERLGLRPDVDALGNITVTTAAANEHSLLVACNLDVPGGLLCSTPGRRNLQFEPLGKLGASDWPGQVVITDLGKRGLVVASPGADPGNGEATRLELDLGVSPGAEEPQEPPGDRFAVALDPGDKNGPRAGLDNRLGCALTLGLLEQAVVSQKALRAVFSVQGQLQGRGCRAIAAWLRAPEALMLEPALCEDDPDSSRAAYQPGRGPVVQVRSGSFVSHPDLVQKLERVAHNTGVNLQRGMGCPENGAAGALQLSDGGTPVAILGPPVWPVKSPLGYYASGDLEQTENLLLAYLSAQQP